MKDEPNLASKKAVVFGNALYETVYVSKKRIIFKKSF